LAPLEVPFENHEAVHVLFMGDGLPLFTDYAGRMFFIPEQRRHFVAINLSPFSGAKSVNEVEKILVHELGHYFGLYHAHHGEDTPLEEFVTRDDRCDYLGDGLCDTPAEPTLFGKVDANCRYNGNQTDEEGVAYEVNAVRNNFMSYVAYVCMQTFSNDQQRLISAVADKLLCESSADLQNDIILTTFPNPFVDQVTIRVEGDYVSEVRILDSKGSLVKAFPRAEWSNRTLIEESIVWKVNESIAPGVYFVQAVSGKTKQVKRVNIAKIQR